MLKRLILLALFATALLSASNIRALVPWTNSINVNNVITITNSPYNASTNAADNSSAIQSAITAAAASGATNGLIGGTVRIPAGVFLSGPLTLANDVNLQLDPGAILRMLPLYSYPGGTNATSDFINGSSLHDLEISGFGAIDGQGLPWWQLVTSNLPVSRPTMFNLSSCSKVLFVNATFSNSPAQHIGLKGNNAGNVTFSNINVIAPSSALPVPQASHNTDAIDLSETNGLIVNCYLSVGDDNVAMGSSAGLARDILITNCLFGTGHGVSMGSFTSSGISNVTVINCTFNGTDNPIRMKSDNNLHGSSKGGLVQNLSYLNLTMTNAANAAIIIYSYYNVSGTPTSVTPATAAGETVDAVGQYTPIWRNITISNIVAYVANGVAGIIWGRTELPVTNIVMSHVTITAPKTFDVYNAQQIQFLDSKILATNSGAKTFTLWNGNVTVSNSVPTTNFVTFDGMGANTNDSFALFNAPASMVSTDAFGASPITLGASVLTNNADFLFSGSDVMNFALGTNSSQFIVAGNLTLGGTNNISAGAGFTNGIYTLMTYTGTLNGAIPVLGATPPGYNYTLYSSSAAPEVDLAVTVLAPTNLVATGTNLQINLKWNSVSGAASYNLKRGIVSGSYPTVFSGLTMTNYTDANVTNAVKYYYVVSAVGAGGESTNSAPTSTTPLPSNLPITVSAQVTGNQLQLAWPQDHLGWRLLIQTNNLSAGLGTNWATVPNSTNLMATNILISPTNGSVFLRLVYP